MKKRSTVLIYLLLILLLSVQAAIQPEKEVPVIWNLSGFDGIAFISFTSSDDKELSSVEMDENISTDKMLTGTASVNLNWDVVSASPVEIALSATGPLTAENIETGIQWALSVGAIPETSAMSQVSDLSFEDWTYEEKVIMSYTPDEDGIGDRGSVELIITSKDASDALPAKYSTTLTAEIRTK